jgi:hypothetical protein
MASVSRLLLSVLASRFAILEAMCRTLDRVKAQKRLCITYDRGKEMAQHEALPPTPGSRSTSPTRTRPGSAASTKTPMDSSASSCPKEKTSAPTPRKNSTNSPGCSTQDQESHWDGNAPLNSSSLISTS